MDKKKEFKEASGPAIRLESSDEGHPNPDASSPGETNQPLVPAIVAGEETGGFVQRQRQEQERDHTGNASSETRLPKKRKRGISLCKSVIWTAFLLPLGILFILMAYVAVTDASMPSVSSCYWKMFFDAENPPGRIESASTALKYREDGIMRLLRSGAYYRMGLRDLSERDTALAVRDGVRVYNVLEPLAFFRITRGVIDKTTVNLLTESLSKPNTSTDDFKEAIAGFALCGRPRQANIAAEILNDPDSLRQPAYFLLKGLATRQMGDQSKALQYLNQAYAACHPPSFTGDSAVYDWDRSIAVRSQLQSCLAHLELAALPQSRSNKGTAREVDVNKANPSAESHIREARKCAANALSIDPKMPEAHLAKAWADLAGNDLAGALSQCDQTEKSFSKPDSPLIEDFMKAAVHRLRAEVFLRQANSTASAAEMKAFQSYPLKYNYFIPANLSRTSPAPEKK